MITEKDLETMGYFEHFSDSPQYSQTLLDYSKWVEGKMLTTGHDRLVENTLGLVGEAGEVAEKIKKKIRDNNKITSDEIVKELGDVLFYTTALANYYNGSLKMLIKMNVEKLDGREARGTLKGSGDDR